MTNSSAITPDDLRSKFTELKSGVETTAGGAEDIAKKGVILAAILMIILVFVLGRKRGRSGRTVVEVRRV